MTTQEMEKLPRPLERTISNLEMSVMAEVVDRIKQAAEVTLVADQLLGSLNRIGFDKKQMKEIIRTALKEADLDVDKIYETAVKADYTQHKALYETVGKQYLPYEENAWLQQVVRAAKEQTKASLKPFENLTQTTGFIVPSAGKKEFVPLTGYFKRILDKNLLAIASGAQTYSQAVGAAIDEMTSSGLRIVNYASGHSDRVEVAARRALMTGVAQMVDKINDHNAKELNTKYWEVDWHPGARNKGFGIMNHQSWQGKVYDDKQMVSICGLGDILGFAGVNCYHVRFPFIPGVSKRKYTDEWLEKQNKKENTPKEYYGKPYDLYAALQHQRKLERTIRKQKQDVELLERAGADKEELTAALSRLQRTKAAYAEFSQTMGIPQQLERWRVGKSFPAVKLGANDSDDARISKPTYVGEIDLKLLNEAVQYYNDQIRNASVEYAVVIDKSGGVYYAVGKEDSVSFEGLDIEGAVITHNHPVNNGIISFSKSDFLFLQENQSVRELIAVNPEFTYSAKVIKDLSEISYNKYYRAAMMEAEDTPDFDIQHKVFEIMDREGIIRYVRQAFNGKTEE